MSIFADEFLDMMPDIVAVWSIKTRDNYGAPTYQDAPTHQYRARVNYQNKNIMGPEGQLVAIRGTAWLATVDPITVDDKVKLPDGTVPKLLMVNQENDESGGAFTKLYFQ